MARAKATKPKRKAPAKRKRRSAKIGQPSKLTPEVQAKVIEALAAGNYAQVAADYAGIANRTYYSWIERGHAAEKLDPVPALEQPYLQFMQAVKEAETKSHMRAVALVQMAMGSDWKAAMTYLERKFPAMWGRRDRMQLEGGEKPIQIDVGEITDEQRKKALHAALKAAGVALSRSVEEGPVGDG